MFEDMNTISSNIAYPRFQAGAWKPELATRTIQFQQRHLKITIFDKY